MTIEPPNAIASTYEQMEEKVAALLKPARLQKSWLRFSILETVEDDEVPWSSDNWIVSYPDFDAVVEGEFQLKHRGKVKNPKYSEFILDAAKDVRLRQPCDHVFLEQIDVEDGKVDYFFGS